MHLVLLALALGSHTLAPAPAAASAGTLSSSPLTLAAASQQPAALPPNPPTDLAAQAASRSTIALTWADQSDDETGFTVERSFDGVAGWGLLATLISNTTTFVDRQRTCNTPYFYRVRAYNPSGTSAPSTAASATILDCTLDAPVALSATPAAQNSIEIRWSDQNDNETGFTVERSPNGVSSWATIASTPPNQTFFADRGLSCSPPLFYRVRAYNAGAVSGWSASVSTHICPPASPTGLTAVALSRMNIALGWADTSDNETGFAIERSPDGAAGWVEIDRIAANSTSYINRGLSCNTAYFYRVRAFHPSAASGYTAIANASTATCVPQTIYVDAGAEGANTGDSWAGAYTDLQNALTAAIAGDQIWAAAGSYRPNMRYLDQYSPLAAFQLPDGVAVYGGFSGAETALDQRDWRQNVTLLSGGGVYHVVTTSSVGRATILDGFTITGGYAIGSNPHGGGAGWYNDRGSPTIRNCTFDGNYAIGVGGGLFNDHGSPLLENVVFQNNTGEVIGGGMANYGGTPILRDVVFRKNRVTNGSIGGGGGLSNTGGGSATLNGVSFEENTSPRYAGGLYNDGSTATVTRASLSGNRGVYGGAITNIGNATLVISDAIFLTNSSQEGAGIANYNSNLTLQYAAFRRNSASYAGGGIYVQYSTGTVALHTLVFTGNYANEGGGVAFNGSAGSLSNATFVGNNAWYGGGLFGIYSALAASNSIVWNNSSLEGGPANGADMRYSLVQGGAAGPGNTSADPRFVDSDGGDNAIGTADDDLRLRGGSPAIDAGDNLALPAAATTDIQGSPRRVDDPSAPDAGLGGSPQIDMGAYEYQNVLPLPMPTNLAASPIRRSQITLRWQDNSADETGFLIERSSNGTLDWSIIATVGAGVITYTDRLLPCNTPYFYRVRATNRLGNSAFESTLAATTSACVPATLYVSQAALAGGNHGGSWADAYLDLQDALNTAIAGDQIWVARGSYTPGARRADSFVLKSGVDLYGGFAGSEAALDQRDWQNNPTLLSGDIGVAGSASDNTYHVLTVRDSGAQQIVDGFTIAGGNGDQTYDMGGGLYALNARLALRNLRFTGNAARMGGAIASDASAIALDGVSVTGNSAWQGGGLYIANASALTLTQALIEDNQSSAVGNAMTDGSGGGGLMAIDSRLRLDHVIFRANQAANNGANGFAAGGGMSSQGGSLSMYDVRFIRNAGDNGGGLFNGTIDARLDHVAFDRNSAAWWGGGLSNQADHLRLSNATFDGNSGSWGGGAYLSGVGSTLANAEFRQNTAYNGAGMVIFGGDPLISNALFSNNTATNSGAGIYNLGAGSPSLAGATFSGNAASASGGAIYNYVGSYIQLRNSVLWGDSAADGPELFVLETGSATASFSIVEGGHPGDGNQGADPRFVRNPGPGGDSAWGTGDDVIGDLHLRADSPAIDAGDNDAVPADTLDLNGDHNTSEPLPLDLDGAGRFADDPDRPDVGHGAAPIVDVGAYEFTPGPIVPPAQPLSNLSVQIHTAHSQVRRGETVTFDIVVGNDGPDPARAITLTTTLPVGLELIVPAAAAASDSWACQYTQASRQLVCTRASLEVGASSTITIAAKLMSASGSLLIDTRVASASASTLEQPASAILQLSLADASLRLWLPQILR
jgi:uncharacterized repeat protein (TIGR01451 family)